MGGEFALAHISFINLNEPKCPKNIRLNRLNNKLSTSSLTVWFLQLVARCWLNRGYRCILVIVVQLLLATHNPGKLREYLALLSALRVQLTSLAEQTVSCEPAETGASFEENARLKARAFAELSGLPTLADDSGLEIDALGGAPGVHSARYGNTGRDQDAQRIQLVLNQLKGVPWEKRTARFRCVVALAVPGQSTHTAHGALEGIIAFQPQGEYGFGYDPIFYLPAFQCTLAQLPPEIKNRISHRAAALEAALPIIQAVLSNLQKA